MMMMRMGSNANERASKQRWKESVAVAVSRSFACCLAAPHTPSHIIIVIIIVLLV